MFQHTEFYNKYLYLHNFNNCVNNNLYNMSNISNIFIIVLVYK